MCAATDRPIAGLLQDLKARGMLEDTLVLWSTEFGRMPFSQGGDGRDHNGGTFVCWMAGGGARPGGAHGESDEWSWRSTVNGTTTYDFHATAMHLLGLNHEKLTFRHSGANLANCFAPARVLLLRPADRTARGRNPGEPFRKQSSFVLNGLPAGPVPTGWAGMPILLVK